MTNAPTSAQNDTAALDELAAAARHVADHVGGATVTIGRNGRGSGVVIAPGQVLTNAHNLRDRTTQVAFADGRQVQATVAGVDVDGDLAVLTVDTAGTTPITWADQAAEQGDIVFAAARGRFGTRVSFGLVSGTGRAFRGPRGRRVTGSVEHTAPLARGSSGGPLLDRHGRLVGLNTNRLGEGFYLAVPADADLKARVEKLASGESVTRPTLGVAIAPAEAARRMRRSVGLPERDGLLVRGVEPGSPAARAGIDQGDLLVSAAGTTLSTADDLFTVLDAHDPATGLEVTLVRGVEERTVTVSFGDEAVSEEGTA